MSYLAKNIKYIRKLRSISSAVLSEELGIPRTTLSGYENGHTEPPVSVAQRISELFNIPLEWLLHKDLSALGALPQAPDEVEPVVLAPEGGGIAIYNLPVSAGLAGLADIGFSEKPVGYIPYMSFTKGAEAAFPVLGFSMEPTVKNGDIIIVKQWHSLDVLDTESIYMLIAAGERMIKRIEPSAVETHIVCRSDNHTAFTVPKKEIAAIYKIVAVIKPL